MIDTEFNKRAVSEVLNIWTKPELVAEEDEEVEMFNHIYIYMHPSYECIPA
jgi:hypothetical protein